MFGSTRGMTTTAQNGKDLLVKVDSDGRSEFVLPGGFGLAALGAKVDDAAAKGARGAEERKTDRSA